MTAGAYAATPIASASVSTADSSTPNFDNSVPACTRHPANYATCIGQAPDAAVPGSCSTPDQKPRPHLRRRTLSGRTVAPRTTHRSNQPLTDAVFPAGTCDRNSATPGTFFSSLLSF